MKNQIKRFLVALALCSTFILQPSSAFAQGTAFTYQGRLNSGSASAGGSYDFRFAVFTTNVNGNAIAGPLTNTAVTVSNGLFTTTVNFGNAFIGASNWLEIAVSTNGANAFITLLPRQQITPTPYAITAENVVGLTVQQNANGSPNVIAGSSLNYVSNSVYGATIGGGGAVNSSNRVTADFGTVGGGGANTASGWASTVGGGAGNTASSPDGSATVGGGYYNTASGDSATVGGGDANTASGYYATVGGGEANTNGSPYATIGGGGYNFIGTNSDSGTISGGFANQIADNTHDATMGGGSYGSIGTNSFGSTIAGGSHNSIGSNAIVAAIGGGTNNNATAFGATIGGGANNIASAWGSTVGGGAGNTASSPDGSATVGGGDANTASGDSSTVGGGYDNTASGYYSTIGGGDANTASGSHATVAGGYNNAANGDYSFVAGNGARALTPGTFVWADSQGGTYSVNLTNSVTFRCRGGVYFTSGAAGGNQTVSWAPGNGSWSFSSDRNLKDGFAPVDSESVLAKVSQLPIVEWSYKGYSQRHIGAMAQDFHTLFPLNNDDKTLNDADLHGVELAAIQGLNDKVEGRSQKAEDRIRKLEKENAELKQRLEALEKIILNRNSN